MVSENYKEERLEFYARELGTKKFSKPYIVAKVFHCYFKWAMVVGYD